MVKGLTFSMSIYNYTTEKVRQTDKYWFWKITIRYKLWSTSINIFYIYDIDYFLWYLSVITTTYHMIRVIYQLLTRLDLWKDYNICFSGTRQRLNRILHIPIVKRFHDVLINMIECVTIRFSFLSKILHDKLPNAIGLVMTVPVRER